MQMQKTNYRILATVRRPRQKTLCIVHSAQCQCTVQQESAGEKQPSAGSFGWVENIEYKASLVFVVIATRRVVVWLALS